MPFTSTDIAYSRTDYNVGDILGIRLDEVTNDRQLK